MFRVRKDYDYVSLYLKTVGGSQKSVVVPIKVESGLDGSFDLVTTSPRCCSLVLARTVWTYCIDTGWVLDYSYSYSYDSDSRC